MLDWFFLFVVVVFQVEPILEVLVGKTLELSVLELMEVSQNSCVNLVQMRLLPSLLAHVRK